MKGLLALQIFPTSHEQTNKRVCRQHICMFCCQLFHVRVFSYFLYHGVIPSECTGCSSIKRSNESLRVRWYIFCLKWNLCIVTFFDFLYFLKIHNDLFNLYATHPQVGYILYRSLNSKNFHFVLASGNNLNIYTILIYCSWFFFLFFFPWAVKIHYLHRNWWWFLCFLLEALVRIGIQVFVNYPFYIVLFVTVSKYITNVKFLKEREKNIKMNEKPEKFLFVLCIENFLYSKVRHLHDYAY